MIFLVLNQNYFKYNTGGAEHQSFLLCKEFIKRGHEVHYVFINLINKEIPYSDEGIILHPLKPLGTNKFFGKPFFLYKNQIYKILKLIKPDYVYHRGLSAFLGIATELAIQLNYKVLWHVALRTDVEKRNVELKGNFISKYLNNKIIKKGIINTNYIFIQEEYHKEMLIKNYKIDKKKILFTKKFFERDLKHPKESAPIIVIWVANIKPVKQFEIFIDLSNLFAKINKEVKFYAIGNLTKGSYQSLIRKKLKNSNVKYLGAKNFKETDMWISKSHIFVNTSKYEGGPPMTFIQSWFSKTPVLSLNVNPDNIFESGKFGFCANGSFDELYKKLNYLIENEKARIEIGINCYNYAVRNYSITNIDVIENTMIEGFNAEG